MTRVCTVSELAFCSLLFIRDVIGITLLRKLGAIESLVEVTGDRRAERHIEALSAMT